MNSIKIILFLALANQSIIFGAANFGQGSDRAYLTNQSISQENLVTLASLLEEPDRKRSASDALAIIDETPDAEVKRIEDTVNAAEPVIKSNRKRRLTVQDPEAYKEKRFKFNENSNRQTQCYDPIKCDIIESNNIKRIQRAIDKGYSVNATYSGCCYKGDTPLIAAIRLNYLDVVNFLIPKADINAINATGYFGTTPLMVAVALERKQIIELLIKSGANLNLQNDYGINALRIAYNRQVNKEIIKLLLEAGADYNQKDIKGESFKSIINKPLYKNEEIIQAFEEFIDNQNKLMDQIFKLTEKNNIKEIIELLSIKPYLIERSNEIGETILSNAILFGQLELIKELFENDLITQKPNLLINKSEENFGISDPIQYAIDLKKSLYITETTKLSIIIDYLKYKKLNQYNLAIGKKFLEFSTEQNLLPKVLNLLTLSYLGIVNPDYDNSQQIVSADQMDQTENELDTQESANV